MCCCCCWSPNSFLLYGNRRFVNTLAPMRCWKSETNCFEQIFNEETGLEAINECFENRDILTDHTNTDCQYFVAHAIFRRLTNFQNNAFVYGWMRAYLYRLATAEITNRIDLPEWSWLIFVRMKLICVDYLFLRTSYLRQWLISWSVFGPTIIIPFSVVICISAVFWLRNRLIGTELSLSHIVFWKISRKIAISSFYRPPCLLFCFIQYNM